MNAIKQLYDRIPSFLKNRYAVSFLVFLVLILLIKSSSNLISTLSLRMELNRKQKQIPVLEKKIKELRKEKELLTTDPGALERFAREKYWMKKKKEDLFIIKRDTLK